MPCFCANVEYPAFIDWKINGITRKGSNKLLGKDKILPLTDGTSCLPPLGEPALVQVIAHHEVSPNGEEDIRLENVAEFIMDQPQAFWLLYILNMNWDVNDEIVEAMIARPDADLAIIAHLFWGSEPSYYCKYPERLPESNVELILRNLRKSRGCLVTRLAPK